MEYSVGMKVFGDWEIVKGLGEGSFGTVYLLRKESGGVVMESALKVIRIPHSRSDIREALAEGMDERSVTSYFQGIVDSLVNEIAVMTSLKSHPNIVSCEDYQVKEHAGETAYHPEGRPFGTDMCTANPCLTLCCAYTLCNGGGYFFCC